MFEFLSLLGVGILWVLFWCAGVRYFHMHGHSPVIGHFLSATLGLIGAFIVLVVVVLPDGHPGGFRTAVLWSAIVLVWWRLRSKDAHRSTDLPAASENVPTHSAFNTDPASPTLVERTTQRNAEKPKTRRRDLPSPVDTKPIGLQKSVADRASGLVVDEIEFSYCDYEGNSTRRKVVVHSITDEHFEGFCLMRKSIRTFRITNVTSDVTRIETGEILSIDDWTAEFKK